MADNSDSNDTVDKAVTEGGSYDIIRQRLIEHIGRDIVQIGDLLVFGYNVFIGLKTTTKIEDVFSLYRLQVEDEKYTMQAVKLAASFLGDDRFRHDFDELYRYYKETKLVQLVHKHGKLLAGFQIGDRLDDCRVLSLMTLNGRLPNGKTS